MTFFGKQRWEDDAHPHESPSVMTIPLILLAVLSAAGGLLLVSNGIATWLEPVVHGEHVEPPLSLLLMTGMTLAVVALGILVAWLVFGRRDIPETAPKGSPITIAARRDLFGDDFNEVVLMQPGEKTVKALVTVDDKGVDGVVNGLAAFTGGLSDRLRRMQTGFVRSYALAILGGAAFVVVAMLAVRLS